MVSPCLQLCPPAMKPSVLTRPHSVPALCQPHPLRSRVLPGGQSPHRLWSVRREGAARAPTGLRLPPPSSHEVPQWALTPWAPGTSCCGLFFSFKNKAFSPVAPSGPALSVCDVHSWCRTEPVGRGVYHCLERRSLICFLIFISEAEHVGRGILISYSRPPGVPGKRKENGS